MNIHDATEQAYKNGYEAGVKEFAERLPEFILHFNKETTMNCVDRAIKYLIKEMMGGLREDSNKRDTSK